MSTNKLFADFIKICSILPVFAVGAGAALAADGTIVNTDTLVLENQNISGQSAQMGAALHNSGTVNIQGGSFTENKTTAQGYGGAIFNNRGLLTIDGTVFDGNVATWDGGAISSASSYIKGKGFDETRAYWTEQNGFDAANKIIVNDAEFKNNVASEYSGGAMGIYSDAIINNTTFSNNNAGGHNPSQSTDGGGAIYAGGWARIDINDSNFDGNSSNRGGAIGTTAAGMSDDVHLKINNTNFTNNSATIGGGAIFNNFADATITDSLFRNNTTQGYGGAIANYNTIKISDSKFIANTSDYVGGAIWADKNTDTEIKNAWFIGNTAQYGGAVYTSNIMKSMKISDTVFKNNTALGVGALGIFAKGELNNVQFINNVATEEEGGALFLGALSQTKLSDSVFTGNQAALFGGAIAMRATSVANNSAAKLDVLNSTFTGNSAGTQGGAIYSAFYNSEMSVDNVYVSNSVFEKNIANEGGAIYNEGIADRGGNLASIKLDTVSFTGNKAKTAGGALYNASGATANLAGTNNFHNNTANGVANDIYNAGRLNIVGGTTTIEGGIDGNGTLIVAEGAQLNIGTALVSQDTINLDGVVMASVLNDQNYGRIYANEMNIGSNSKLKLNVGGAGVYKIFNTAADITIDAGAAYTVENHGADGVIISTKSVEKIAQDTGLTNMAASTIAGLANNTDAMYNLASLNAQAALAAGDVDYIESESAKAHPIDKPVVHSISSSVQNQVLQLASARMSGGAIMGRSGGDFVNADFGMWAHGLFNKTKFGDQFHGYTRGVAAGFDAQINRKYTVGLGYAYNTGDVHATARDTDISSNTIFVYGQYKPTNWYVNAALNYTMSKYDEAMEIFGVSVNHEHDVDTFGGQVMTGYDFATGLTPMAGLRYLHISQDDYNNGLGRVRGGDSDFLTGIAGIKYEFAIENDWPVKFAPQLRAAATYDFASDDTQATVVMPGAPAYIVNGDRLSRMGGEFGIGLSANYHGLDIMLDYSLTLHQDYTSQTGMVKLRYNF